AGDRQRASRQGRRALDARRLGPTRLDWTRSGMERFPHGYDWRKTSTRQWHAHRPGASVLPSSFIRTMTVGSGIRPDLLTFPRPFEVSPEPLTGYPPGAPCPRGGVAPLL